MLGPHIFGGSLCTGLTVADVMGVMGLRIANADAMPAWLAPYVEI